MRFFSEIRKKLEGGTGGWKETLKNEREEDRRKLEEAEKNLLKVQAEHEAAKKRLLSVSRNANGDEVEENDAKRISELRRKIEDHE